MDSAEARAKLLQHPEEFLRYYPVKSAGSTAPNQNDVNLRDYYINKQGDGEPPPRGQKVGHKGATRPGLLGIRLNISSFMLQNYPALNSALIHNAHVVPMVNYNANDPNLHDLQGTIGSMPYYALRDGGDGLMVTGELSNCCFCWLPMGNDLWCIHVQPGNTITAVNLQEKLGTDGRFNGWANSPLGTFGRMNYPGGDERATVVGVRSGYQ